MIAHPCKSALYIWAPGHFIGPTKPSIPMTSYGSALKSGVFVRFQSVAPVYEMRCNSKIICIHWLF